MAHHGPAVCRAHEGLPCAPSIRDLRTELLHSAYPDDACRSLRYIWGLSILVRELIDVRAAAITSLVLSIHPAYLTQTIYDLGGIAEWMVPFGVLSIALARYLRLRTTNSAMWLGAAMGFGVWSRANVVWLLGSALLSGMFVLGKRMLVPLRHLAALAG